MTVFVDTSAWYALACATDQDHAAARHIYTSLLESDTALTTTSYVLAETMGLIQHRLGWEPLELFVTASRSINIVWIEGAYHADGERILLQRRRKGVNIVDATSFAVMRALGIDQAFTFDSDFESEGFKVLGA